MCELCRDLGSQARAADQGGEVDVVHEDLGTVVRGVTCRQELTRTQIRDGAVEERAVVEGVGHRPLLQSRLRTRESVPWSGPCGKPLTERYPDLEGLTAAG